MGLDPSKRGECSLGWHRQWRNASHPQAQETIKIGILSSFPHPQCWLCWPRFKDLLGLRPQLHWGNAWGTGLAAPFLFPMGSVLFSKGHSWPLGPAASTAGSGSTLASPLHREMKRPGEKAFPEIALGLLQGPGLARGMGRPV